MAAPDSDLRLSDVETVIRDRLGDRSIRPAGVLTRHYPDETVFIVEVAPGDLQAASAVSNEVDVLLAASGVKAFTTVRIANEGNGRGSAAPVKEGVADGRATELRQLIIARARTSEIQPSLSYIPDTATNIAAAVTPRHHLVFGRRGAGKTALMLEAKRLVQLEGHYSVWTNVQTLRRDPPHVIFGRVVSQIAEMVQSQFAGKAVTPLIAAEAAEIGERLRTPLSLGQLDRAEAERLIPVVQGLLRRFLDLRGVRLFLFVDDFYYIERGDQPVLLDMLHGSVRDCDAWLKVASIRHLTKWFQASPPTGLQTGQDADILDLDVTLQEPGRAERFLDAVLKKYADHVGIPRLSAVFSAAALDRLVLASGAVPRDFLRLAADSVTQAQARANARLVGVQDVNQAAGDAAQAKLLELEEDLAANVGVAGRTLAGLSSLRVFCLEETRYTFVRVNLLDKEEAPSSYEVLTNLLDVRLVHLIHPAVSDSKRAGVRYEVFMLDLSQFSGQRLKQEIRVLDLDRGVLVSKRTRSRESPRRGDTARKLLTLLRSAPLLELDRFVSGVDAAP